MKQKPVASVTLVERIQSVDELRRALPVLRKLRQMTQHDLAREAGLSVTTVGHLEAHDRGVSLETALAMLRALGIAMYLGEASDDATQPIEAPGYLKKLGQRKLKGSD